MKKVREFCIVAIMLALLVLAVNVAFGGYDYNPQPKPAQDIIDALMAVPVATLDKFGHTERTKLIFNIARLIDFAKSQEAKILEMEKRIVVLEVVDVNEVSK